MSGSIETTQGSSQTTRPRGATSRRFMVLASLVFLLVAVIVWILFATLGRVGRIQDEFAGAQTQGFYLGTELQGSVWKLNGRLLRLQLSDDASERERFLAETRALTDWIARTRPKVTTAQQQELAVRVQEAFARYLADTAPLLEERIRPVRKDSASIAYQQITEKSEALLQLCQKLVECQDASLSRHFAAAGTLLGDLRRLMQLSAVLLLACTVVIAVLAYKAVVAPLRLRLGETEQAVVRQEKLASLGTLAAGIAHEIRNPLTAIKFRLFSFQKDLPGSWAQHEDLEVINDEIERLEHIVDDFLQFARPSEPQFSEVIVADVLSKVHDLLKGTLEKKGVRLELEPPDPIKLSADARQLQQLLINLVQNAADSAGPNGIIRLRATHAIENVGKQPRPVVAIDVNDNGPGIPAEVEPRIFDPFFSTKESGTGLGLPIAARIAAKHQGSIRYQSHPRQGTTFSVVLPATSNHGHENSPH